MQQLCLGIAVAAGGGVLQQPQCRARRSVPEGDMVDELPG
jgi:hypothetical protein